MSDRVYVMRAGRLVLELSHEEIDANEIMRHAAGALPAPDQVTGAVHVN